MLIPGICIYLVFRYYPMLGLQIAFKDFKLGHGIWGSPWVGLKHFDNFFNQYYFSRMLINTVTLSMYSLLANTPVVIILSLCLHSLRSERMKKVVQTVVYMPHFITTVVICGILMRMFNQRIGIFPQLFQALFGSKPDVLGNPNAFAHLYVWSGIWQNAGWGTIIYMAALSGVSPELHEAAIIDGASRFKRVLHVDLPAIIPTIVIMLIMDSGRILNVGFEKILLLQNQLNVSTSEVISTYTYKITFESSRAQYSLATAIGLFNSAASFLMVTIVNRIAGALDQNSLW